MTQAFRSLLRHETILGLLLLAALVVLAFQSDRFFTADNLLNQGRLMAEVGLVALAMTFVIVTGGIDLSVGSILGLVAILLGVFWQKLGIPLPLAMVTPLPRSQIRMTMFRRSMTFTNSTLVRSGNFG